MSGLFPESGDSNSNRSSNKRPNSPSLPTPTAPPQSTTGKVKRGRKTKSDISTTSLGDGSPGLYSQSQLSQNDVSYKTMVDIRNREILDPLTAASSSSTSSDISGFGSITSLSASTEFAASQLRQNIPSSGLKSFGGLGAITWTETEDAELSQAIASIGTSDWTAVAQLVPRRTAQQCMSRWLRALKQGEVKKEWHPLEDEMIRNFVQKSGDPSKVVWTEIAQKLEGRIGKQCRERWFFHLDPNLKRTPFDEEEDRRLFEAQRALGNKWSEIARLLPGRNENSVKNRWNSVARRKWFVDHGLPLAERDALALLQHAKLSHLDWKIEENLQLASRHSSPELAFMSGRPYSIGIGWISGPMSTSSIDNASSESITESSVTAITSRQSADDVLAMQGTTSVEQNFLSHDSSTTTIQPLQSLTNLNFSLYLLPTETSRLCSVEAESILIYRLNGEFPHISLRLRTRLPPDDAPFVQFSFEIASLFYSAGILHEIKTQDVDTIAPLSNTMRDLVVFPESGKSNFSSSSSTFLTNSFTSSQATLQTIPSALFGLHGTQWVFDTMKNEYLFVKTGRRTGALSTTDSASGPEAFSVGANKGIGAFKVTSDRKKKSSQLQKKDVGMKEVLSINRTFSDSSTLASSIISEPTAQEIISITEGRIKVLAADTLPISSLSVPVLSPNYNMEPSPEAETLGGLVDRFQSFSQQTDRPIDNRLHTLVSNNSHESWHQDQKVSNKKGKDAIAIDLASPVPDRQHLIRTSSSGSNGSAAIQFTLQPFVLQSSLPFSEAIPSLGDTSSSSFVIPALVHRSTDNIKSAPSFLSSADLNRGSATTVFINALSSPNSSGTGTPGSKSKPSSDLPSPIDIANLFEFKHVSSPTRER